MARKRRSRTGALPAASAMDGGQAMPKRSWRAGWFAPLVALLVLVGAAWYTARQEGTPASPVAETPLAKSTTASAAFVGSDACARCHESQHAAWTRSQHARAMQHASADTVLGDFDNASYSRDGVTSSFFRRDGRFFVRTDGPDGKLADYEVKYTFGLEPLQQYLVEFPGGRLQALALSWDARPRNAGGQRWFRQYPDEKLDFRDELHWTKRSQNWNFMCADCHSTNVRKGYDVSKKAFSTAWSEISVGCEACHGPGSAHIAWAGTRSASDANRGLTVALDERHGVAWSVDPVSGNGRRSSERRSGREIEVCAQCHARRAQITEGYRAGQPFMDHYLPSTLSAGLYYADGQQREEVFTWGSFLQSRMFRAGVTCSDCHDPHTQELRAPGNAMCGQCHSASKYDGKSHHFHDPASAGGQCANCHMPATTYMVVDPRRDHSFRVPRPDLSVAIGTPNACNGCHSGKTPQWARDAVARWYGPQRRSEPHYGEVLDAGRHSKPGAARGLIALVTGASVPPIVRATAIELLAQFPGRAAEQAMRQALGDSDPLVRHAAVLAQESLPFERMVPLLSPLLSDPVRAVRIEAARAVAPASARLDPADKALFATAIGEFEAGQRESLDRPEAWMNLGNLYAGNQEAARAEEAYRTAIERDPTFVPAYVNLADLKRDAQREAEAEAILRDGLRAVPKAAALREALGLALVRQGRKSEALAELEAAYKAAPDQPRYAYLYAVALHDAGRRADAIRVLADSAKRRGSRDLLLVLAMYRGEAGDGAGADAALRTLAAINPDDPALAQFRQQR
jgi:tetratricopeptide (TPR) repeat protein